MNIPWSDNKKLAVWEDNFKPEYVFELKNPTDIKKYLP